MAKNLLVPFGVLILTCSLILLSSTGVRTLLGTEKSVIPCQLLQFVVSPFFGRFTNRPHFQSFGISPSVLIFSNRGCSILAVLSKSTFTTSGEILSAPAAFPLRNSFSAFLIYTTVETLVLILGFASYSSSSSSSISSSST